MDRESFPPSHRDDSLREEYTLSDNLDKETLLNERTKLNAQLAELNNQLEQGGAQLKNMDLTPQHRATMQHVTASILADIAKINLKLVKIDTELEQLDKQEVIEKARPGVWNNPHYFGGRPD